MLRTYSRVGFFLHLFVHVEDVLNTIKSIKVKSKVVFLIFLNGKTTQFNNKTRLNVAVWSQGGVIHV